MKIRQFAAIALQTTILLLVSSTAQPAAAQTQPILSSSPASVPDQARVSALLRSSPVMFIENVGQFADGARFQVRGGNGTVYLADDAMWVTVLEKPNTIATSSPTSSTPKHANEPQNDTPRPGVNLKLSFVGANPKPRLEPFNRLDTHVSYFIGNDSKKWRADVPVWGGVRYKDLYPGIDLEVTSENGQMIQRVVTRAGANLNAVRLRVDGADKMTLEGDHLRLATTVGEYTMPLLQVAGATSARLPRPTIAGNQVTSPFTSAIPQSAIANPQSGVSDLLYATFLGGSGGDSGYAIAIDETGSAYVTGFTDSTNFIATTGVFSSTNSGNGDVFVSKLNSSGSGLAYSTFIGGNATDSGNSIAVDVNGIAYITGWTNSFDFPTTADAFKKICSFCGAYWYPDVFIAKINSTGSELVFSTYIGLGLRDQGLGITIDTSGAAYVTGSTIDPNFPTTQGAFDTTYGGGYCVGEPCADVFVVKLNAVGSALIYGTFLGGSGNDLGYSIAVAGDGAAYVTGGTSSADFPTTSGAFQATCGGGYSIFTTKLNPGGTELMYSTCLAGSGGFGYGDFGFGIAVDEGGLAYVTGLTRNTNFPTTPGALQTIFKGGDGESFVTKFNANGTGLVYSTLLGGGAGNPYTSDFGRSIVVDKSNAVYVTGYTQNWDFPTTPNAFDTSYNGGDCSGNNRLCFDAFVVKLNPSGTSLLYGTFLGGFGDDFGNSVAIDGTGAGCITGYTNATNFPITPSAFNTIYDGGYWDAFVTKLAIGNTPATYSISGRVTDGNSNAISGVTISDGAGHTATTDGNGNYTLSGLVAGTYTLTPAKSGYPFSPTLRTVTVPPDATGQDFTGMQILPWTLMFYLDGDNNLDSAFANILNQLELVANNSSTNVLVLRDRAGNNNSAYYKVQYDTDISNLATYTTNINYWSKGELNMGNPQTLIDFVTWARTNYPAQHYALWITNHGTGLNGTARDDTSGGDWLTVRELGDALNTISTSGANKIDVVFADSCFMAMVETAYQIRNYVSYYVASENEIFFPPPGSVAPYANYVSGVTALTSARDLASSIVTQYANWATNYIGDPNKTLPYTISAVDMGQIDGLVTAMSNLGTSLRAQMPTYASQIRTAHIATQRFDSLQANYVIDLNDEYVDVSDFAMQIQTQISDPTIQSQASAVRSAVTAYKVNESHHSGTYLGHIWNLDRSNGVSVFLPNKPRSFYTGLGLDFAAGTVWNVQQQAPRPKSATAGIDWGPMLVEYVRVTNPTAPDDPNPPALASPLSPTKPGNMIFLPMIVR